MDGTSKRGNCKEPGGTEGVIINIIGQVRYKNNI